MPGKTSLKLFAPCALVLAGGTMFGGKLSAASPAPSSAALTNNPIYQAEQWFEQQRAYPLDAIPPGVRARAMHQSLTIDKRINAQTLAMERRIKSRGTLAPMIPAAPSNLWVNIGPAPIANGQVAPTQPVSGRIQSVAVDPSNPDHWLAAAAQGGIWSTTDGGTTWIPLTDNQPSLAMGDVVFAPSAPGTIYAGTGESDHSIDSYAGAGLLKSTDGGASWQTLATNIFLNTSFSHIKVNPTNANELVATTAPGRAGRGPGWAPNAPPTGVFKSTDGGVTWSLKIKGEGKGLDVNPANFNQQYAAMGNIFGDSANGVYRSLDGGETWSLVSGPWGAGGNLGRIEVAIAPSSPDTVYVSIQDPITFSSLGVWESDDAWDTNTATPVWAQLPAIPTSGAQYWYDHVLLADQASSNVLYLGETPLWKYDGSSWTAIAGNYGVNDNGVNIHPDQHALAWAGNTLLIGNDGGVWSTSDGGNTFSNRNGNLAVTQFYNGSAHPANPTMAIGGTQDNGTVMWSGSNAWQLVYQGDGGQTAISSTAPDTDWAVEYIYLGIARTEDGGVTFTNAATGIDPGGAPFIARFAEFEGNPDLFIAGTVNLWKCTNFFSGATATWTVNSPPLNGGATVSAVAFAPSDSTGNTYAFGGSDGALFVTTNGGAIWTDMYPINAAPSRFVTSLAFDPTNANILYAALSGFDEGTPGHPGHLFVTRNALSPAPAWSDISPPVDLPNNAVVVDPQNSSTLYVGADIGVWQTIDGGSSWSHHGPEVGMPNVAVFDLQINRVTQRLFAFTHGRSALMLQLNSGGGTNSTADVFVSMRTRSTVGIMGSDLTYTITVGNNGPLAATNVVMIQTLPTNAPLAGQPVASQGTVQSAATTVTANLGDLAPGDTATVTVTVVPAAVGTLSSSATAGSDTPEGDPLDNNATVATWVIPIPQPQIIAGGATLVSESFTPPDGTVDPGEQVSVSLALANAGNLDTADLMATLLNSGGVTLSSGAQDYGVIVHNGPAVSRTFSFTAAVTNGPIVATLQLEDGTNNLGTVSFTFQPPRESSFANTNSIAIPDHGAGTPYPSVINVSGLTGVVSAATVTLSNFNHTFPHDINVLLASPSGREVLVMSHAGGGYALTNCDLTFDDAAAAALPNFGQIISGVYRPSAYQLGVVFPAPAPIGAPGLVLSGLQGEAPNGAWLLYLFDDQSSDSGNIASGWSLNLTAVEPVNGAADLNLSGTVSPAAVLAGAVQTNVLIIGNAGPDTAPNVVLTNILPVGAVYAGSALSQGSVSVSGSTVACSFGSVAAGTSATANIYFTSETVGAFTGRASAGSDALDLNPGDNLLDLSGSVVATPIENGGFETGNFTDWTLAGDFAANIVGADAGYVHSGTYGAELGQYGGAAFLSQTAKTLPGMYVLSFWLANPEILGSAGPNEFKVSWNGTTLFDQVNMGQFDFTNLQFFVSASGEVSPLQFGARNDFDYFALDDVSVVPVPPPNFQSASMANNTFSLSWATAPGARYQVQCRDDLISGSWTSLGGAFSATNSSTTVADPATGSRRFYRIILLPP